jgi:hypothetical protein
MYEIQNFSPSQTVLVASPKLLWPNEAYCIFHCIPKKIYAGMHFVMGQLSITGQVPCSNNLLLLDNGAIKNHWTGALLKQLPIAKQWGN